MSDHRIPLLLEIVDQAFHKRAWHGTTLRGSLRGLEVGTAVWKPRPDRHSIWELFLHAAYWKYIGRRHLAGDTATIFGRKPRNWPAVPEHPTAALLKADIAFLQKEHRVFRAALAAFSPAHLNRRVGKTDLTFAGLIHGVAAHDLYHTGQIQLLKKLRKEP